ncbi:MAG: M14 family zinc carboxypeptidase [Lachnospiraceae bacterium]|nr:M14 family zinc carboxypeptidase [Lachnospiraceae bacterium]
MITLEKCFTYDELFGLMKDLSEEYKEFVLCRIIGQTHDDRLIPMLRVGVGTPALLCSAGMHGRENVNPIIMLKIVEEYCSAYRHKEFIQQCSVYDLLNQFSICFIPVVNPDGYEIAQRGFDVIHNPILRQMCKMKNITHENWKYNARGVDINRNFPSKTYIQQQFYEYPGSENETQALMRLFQDYDSMGYVDFHSRGKIIYYYRQCMSSLYNQRSHRLAKYLQKLSRYNLGTKDEELMSNMSGGHSVHYYSELTGKPALTIETVEDDATFPLDEKYQKEAYEEIRTIPIGILEMA